MLKFIFTVLLIIFLLRLLSGGLRIYINRSSFPPGYPPSQQKPRKPEGEISIQQHTKAKGNKGSKANDEEFTDYEEIK